MYSSCLICVAHTHTLAHTLPSTWVPPKVHLVASIYCLRSNVPGRTSTPSTDPSDVHCLCCCCSGHCCNVAPPQMCACQCVCVCVDNILQRHKCIINLAFCACTSARVFVRGALFYLPFTRLDSIRLDSSCLASTPS